MPRLPLAATLVALMLVPASASARDYAATARNVVPSGQWGGVPVPPGADSQAKLYDSLTPRFDEVTAADLDRSFKSERFGVGPDGPAKTERVPRRGVRLVRDRYNVPHITGRTRDDVTWAMGWVLQEDRGLLLAQGRYPARLAAVDAPSINAFGLVTGLKTVKPSKHVNRTIRRNGLRALRSAGPDGRRLLHDIDVFVAGLNARLRAEKSTAERFSRVDLFATNALVGQIFGEGGGGEGRRGQFYGALRARIGAEGAKVLFDDLSEHNDADTPTTLTRTTPFAKVPRTPRGNAILDAGSLRPTATAGASAARRTTPGWASNFQIIGRSRSATGHPLFVGGPQIGYFYPGLTLEADVRWPGHQARGVYSPANPGAILIGRGEDFAWSLTSAGSDLVDEFAEVLCGGSRTRYRYRGRCRRMGTVDAGAIVGRDVLWQLPFRDAAIGRVAGTRSFIRAFARSPFTFNVGYADDRDIAMFSAGELPRRDPRVDPRLPTLGTGGYEWRGILPSRRLPRQVNPAGGALLNWNNSPAPGFGAADNNWSYGSLHRVALLRGQIGRRAVHDLASVTGAMNAAATQDLRSVGLTPTLSTLLRGGPAPSARALRMLTLLEAWRAGGSSRLDRDEDGAIDAGPAAAIMDAFYPRLLDAVLGGALGPQLADLKALEGADNSPGSGFTGGGINYIDKDLRQLLGTRFKRPFRTRFCGGGDVA